MSARKTRVRIVMRVVVAAGTAALFFVSLPALRVGAAENQEAVRVGELGRRPIEITADRLNADSATDSVTFEGNVVAIQADVTLHADLLRAEYSQATRTIDKITAEGNVRVVQAGREARAARAVFYNQEQRIVLTGGAELEQDKNTLKGDTVTIYLRENRSVVTGGKGGRVRAVLHPQGLLEGKGKEER